MPPPVGRDPRVGAPRVDEQLGRGEGDALAARRRDAAARREERRRVAEGPPAAAADAASGDDSEPAPKATATRGGAPASGAEPQWSRRCEKASTPPMGAGSARTWRNDAGPAAKHPSSGDRPPSPAA